MADDEVTIDWGQASVDGGRLTVPYAGKPPAGFKPALTHVLERSEADQTMTDAFRDFG